MTLQMADDTVTALTPLLPGGFFTGRTLRQYWTQVAESSGSIESHAAQSEKQEGTLLVPPLSLWERVHLASTRILITRLLPLEWVAKAAAAFWFRKYESVMGQRTALAAEMPADTRFHLKDLDLSTATA